MLRVGPSQAEAAGSRATTAPTPPRNTSTTVRHASTTGRPVSASNVQKARSPATSHAPTTTAAARCASSMTTWLLLIPDNAEPCDAAAQWCIIMWELVGEDMGAKPLAAPHMVGVAGTAVPPSSCNAACNSPCPPASNATARAGLDRAPANGATRSTVITNNGTSTEVAGVTPSAAAWPASPHANSTDGSVSTRTWRSFASLVMARSTPECPPIYRPRERQTLFWTELEIQVLSNG